MDSNQVNSVIDNLGSKIKPALDTLSSSMGIATEKVCEVLIRQAFVDGVLYSIGAVIGLILIIISLTLFRKATEKGKDGKNKYDIWNENYSYWSDTACGFTVVYIAILILGILMFAFNIGDALTALINPEYYAFNKILETITKITTKQ